MRARPIWMLIVEVALPAAWAVLLFQTTRDNWQNNETALIAFYAVSVLGIACALTEIFRRRRTKNTLNEGY